MVKLGFKEDGGGGGGAGRWRWSLAAGEGRKQDGKGEEWFWLDIVFEIKLFDEWEKNGGKLGFIKVHRIGDKGQ